MKAYIDTNVVIDVLECRKPHFVNSDKVFHLVVDGVIDGIISASAVTDLFYLLKKYFADTKVTMDVIFDVLEVIKPVDTLTQDLFSAARLGFDDFEDAVISAVAFREDAGYIITRNTSDFSMSKVPAITPEDFLSIKTISK